MAPPPPPPPPPPHRSYREGLWMAHRLLVLFATSLPGTFLFAHPTFMPAFAFGLCTLALEVVFRRVRPALFVCVHRLCFPLSFAEGTLAVRDVFRRVGLLVPWFRPCVAIRTSLRGNAPAWAPAWAASPRRRSARGAWPPLPASGGCSGSGSAASWLRLPAATPACNQPPLPVTNRPRPPHPTPHRCACTCSC